MLTKLDLITSYLILFENLKIGIMAKSLKFLDNVEIEKFTFLSLSSTKYNRLCLILVGQDIIDHLLSS